VPTAGTHGWTLTTSLLCTYCSRQSLKLQRGAAWLATFLEAWRKTAFASRTIVSCCCLPAFPLGSHRRDSIMCGRSAVGAIRSRGHGCGQETKEGDSGGPPTGTWKPWHSPVPSRPRGPVVGSSVHPKYFAHPHGTYRTSDECGAGKPGAWLAGGQGPLGEKRGGEDWTARVPCNPQLFWSWVSFQPGFDSARGILTLPTLVVQYLERMSGTRQPAHSACSRRWSRDAVLEQALAPCASSPLGSTCGFWLIP
jgi:hypothetical protein